MGVRFVTIAKFTSINDADFCRALLEAQGFNAFTLGGHTFPGGFFPVPDRVRLQVPEDQARAATDFLRNQPPPPDDYEADADSDSPGPEPVGNFPPACSTCGAALSPPPNLQLGWRVWLAFLTGTGACYFFDGSERHGMAIVSGAVIAGCVALFLLARKREWRCLECADGESDR